MTNNNEPGLQQHLKLEISNCVLGGHLSNMSTSFCSDWNMLLNSYKSHSFQPVYKALWASKYCQQVWVDDVLPPSNSNNKFYLYSAFLDTQKRIIKDATKK